ncbi:hypothetical protein ACFLXI_03635 [Chloroflexota bacterium]
MWLLLLLGPLLLLQRALHREIQSVFLLVTRRPEITVAMFSLLFFPGVLLHEGSHYLMAKILGVSTGRVSLIPESVEGNRLRLGFVETGETDIVRDALIGTAPLLLGGLFVAYAGIVQLDLLAVWNGISIGNTEAAIEGLKASFAVPDFWLWFYLTVAVSSTMFPSPSDRRAWLPVTLIVVLIVGLALLFGAGPWMSENLLPALNDGLHGVAIVFAISLGVNLVVIIPTWLMRKILNKVTGFQVRS